MDPARYREVGVKERALLAFEVSKTVCGLSPLGADLAAVHYRDGSSAEVELAGTLHEWLLSII